MFDRVECCVSNEQSSKALFVTAFEPLGVAVVSEGLPRGTKDRGIRCTLTLVKIPGLLAQCTGIRI